MITNLELTLTTAVIAVVSAALSILLGVPFGNWLAALAPKLQRVIGAISVVPFLLPPLLIAVAIKAVTPELEVDSEIGMLLIVLAHALMNIGFVGRVVAGSALPSEQIEAARLDGARDSLIRKFIQLPQQSGAIAGAGLLVALYSATSFGLVLLLGAGFVRTLETEIADSALQRLDLGQAAVLAALQTLLTLALFVFASRFSSGGFTLNQVSSSNLKAGSVSNLVSGFYLTVVMVVLGSVVFRSLSSEEPFANFVNLDSLGTRSLLNVSVLEATGNSLRNMIVVLLISLPIAYLWAGRAKNSFLILLPIGISSVVIGLTALVLSGYLPREISSSWLVVPAVQSIIAIPLAYQIIRPARRSLDREILDAASLDGVSRLQRIRLIELPLIARPLSITLAFVGMSSLGEFGAASFLAFGSDETLPIVMFRLASRPGGDNFGMAMAAGAIYILLTAWIVWLSSRPSQTSHQSHSGA